MHVGLKTFTPFKYGETSRWQHTVPSAAGAGLWCFACRGKFLQGNMSVAIECHRGLALPAGMPFQTYACGTESANDIIT
jgi:hypothetical protein